ncbi:hypothetical protein S2091_0019 [Solimicrobium silvestre]|uniref:Uncharacterized protein n=1 Tax=Solimicrobium silvestre TaxID=2099400 RepID=A0A2S9H4A8_9BURK|nr:hypothetical protein S2091_0019 [Solimicrobium silvestre]
MCVRCMFAACLIFSIADTGQIYKRRLIYANTLLSACAGLRQSKHSQINLTFAFFTLIQTAIRAVQIQNAILSVYCVQLIWTMHVKLMALLIAHHLWKRHIAFHRFDHAALMRLHFLFDHIYENQRLHEVGHHFPHIHQYELSQRRIHLEQYLVVEQKLNLPFLPNQLTLGD